CLVVLAVVSPMQTHGLSLCNCRAPDRIGCTCIFGKLASQTAHLYVFCCLPFRWLPGISPARHHQWCEIGGDAFSNRSAVGQSPSGIPGRIWNDRDLPVL